MYRILGLAAGCLMLLCLQGICLAAEERVSLQPMCDLDGKTKDDLVKLREKSMIYSAFYRYDYQPKIFDRYDAKEKWIGNRYSCYRNRFYDGNSEASIWLKNPNILVHPFAGTIYHMYYGKTNNPVFCMYAKQLLFKPKSIVYNEEKKEITTTYKAYNILLGRGSHTFGALNFGLFPINAYDVGFNYISLAESKGLASSGRRDRKTLESAMGAVWALNEDVSVCNPCYERRDDVCICYTKDGSLDVVLKRQNAEMLFKLWKEKPKSKNDDADFYYRIRFVSY